MTIWWCLEHERNGNRNACSARVKVERCPMVEMVLAPKGSLVIEKVDGEWPEWALEAAQPYKPFTLQSGDQIMQRQTPVRLLDALSVQSESQT